MSKAKKKKKKNNVNFAAIGVLIGISLGIGYLIGTFSFVDIPEDAGFFEFMSGLILEMLLLVAAFIIQTIIHEGGHLIAGLMTGYKFSSFRIGSIMLLKTHEGYSFKKFSLAGTGGQCLLIPPDKNDDGNYSYKLYHIGGVLLNVITAAVFFAGFCLIPEGIFIRSFVLYLAIMGILTAVINGIPMRTGGIATDGYNALHIGKEPFALEAMWLQLKINEAQTEGIRLKDLPDEWFRLPEGAAKNNEIISTITVFSENRAMDRLDFQKAKEIMNMLEHDEEYSILGVYKSMLAFDKVTIELIENGKDADVSILESKDVKALRKSMAKNLSVIRTEYAVALLKENDIKTAEKCKRLFDKVASKYPLKSDIEAESEIMECVDSHRNSI